jgi:multisubunit Na+/H+ antiporter MnhC subunit
MHVSLAIDEAGASYLNGFFENVDNTMKIVCALESMADSILLVICGTGVTAETSPPGVNLSNSACNCGFKVT